MLILPFFPFQPHHREGPSHERVRQAHRPPAQEGHPRRGVLGLAVQQDRAGSGFAAPAGSGRGLRVHTRGRGKRKRKEEEEVTTQKVTSLLRTNQGQCLILKHD